MRFAVLRFLACSIGLAQALVIPGTSAVKTVLLRNVASHQSLPIAPRGGKCPKVNLVRGKKCVRTLNAKQSNVCLLPSQIKDEPKPTATIAPKVPVRSGKSVPKPEVLSIPPKASARTVGEELAILTLDERADKTLGEMNEIASFDWGIGDTATTSGLEGCSVIALYNDKAIVWGHYSPGMTLNDETFLDHQKTLDLALGKIEAKARTVGILGTGQAKGVVRVDSRAAGITVPPGMPNIPQIIAAWYQKLGVTILNRATYNSPLPRGTCTIEHASRANGEVRVTMA